jgi:sulfide:quinone oxidoreductase
MDVLIAGGGVAGLEALLALRALAGDRVRLTLASADEEFTYRPLAVAQPFALGSPYRVPLTRFTEETGAELVIDAVVAVDDDAGTVRLGRGSTRSFEALLLAPGGRAVEGVEGATTWWPGGDAETYGGLLRDIDEGYAKRVAIAVPPGMVWPLPAYELALMTAGEARAMGHEDVQVTVLTPERSALSLFGEQAGAAVEQELRRAGVELRTGVVARRDRSGVVLEPGGEPIDVQRIFAVPRILGPALEGVPCDEEGFIVAGEDTRVEGCRRTWAAGDGVVSPLKFGGVATHQARRAAAAIAREAGADAPDPGEPVIHGRLLVGRRTRRLRGRGDAEGAPLWWPQGKIAGEYLPRWLTEHGITPPSLDEPPDGESVTVEQPLSRASGAEAQYLFNLARQFRSADPAIASLGRRMRELRDR